ncbi:putative lipoprotein [Collimonas fungivorans]|uniref:Putative lipoprotein n=1 Tax=Collimonas fungivorans TaxID=158899 RepID=A0A127PE30_9BURK|nr:hypothetical protein [Collimonas fungivorans]AMO96049.1 putative lipoprotein [Collimonas fungivorans]
MNIKNILGNSMLVLATVACHAQSTVAKPLQPVVPGKAAAKSQQPDSKIGAPVSVELVSSGATSKNVTLPVQLQFKTDQPNTPLQVEYRGNDGLSLVTLGTATLISNQQGIVTDTPNVRAAADGVYDLNVFVTVGERTRAVSIPVTVGNAKPVKKAAGKAMRTPQGEDLTIMPAQEKSH